MSEKIELQKKHYKDGKNSICKKCENYNSDCFSTMKFCEKDKDGVFSIVTKCNMFKEKISNNAVKK